MDKRPPLRSESIRRVRRGRTCNGPPASWRGPDAQGDADKTLRDTLAFVGNAATWGLAIAAIAAVLIVFVGGGLLS